MRTLGDIIEAAKGGRGEMPPHEECYFATLALSYLLGMDHRDLREVCLDPNPVRLKLTLDGSFLRYKSAIDATPMAWLGPSYTPGNSEYERVRESAFRVLKKVCPEAMGDGPAG